ncbi:hypothetical protein HMPREF9123_2490 [Neisseria bacilliformis ATCC BAA-1200]|uniref:Uncharacterized protein n=1 Tax=Neisseria bacilliformis ATCC BAA-1200 TaxID=888742 RepID=F2BFI3_9NEIS|nr:hypothetical protein HMPREF9123_2490 [Neisseria bacilliformis ATCC BAA-1200]
MAADNLFFCFFSDGLKPPNRLRPSENVACRAFGRPACRPCAAGHKIGGLAPVSVRPFKKQESTQP